MLTHYIVLWSKPSWRTTFRGDVYANTPREALARFKRIFPGDVVFGVKRAKGGRGRFEA